MGKNNEIRAVEVIRRIRDEQAGMLQGKSNEEIIEFFRKAADDFRMKAVSGPRTAANNCIQPTARNARRG
ncbi:MAG: hypothetical protein DDT29_01693 [Dehalococcoidia bacterium]|nr:hypothetical protein [Bacillota bacterium]